MSRPHIAQILCQLQTIAYRKWQIYFHKSFTETFQKYLLKTFTQPWQQPRSTQKCQTQIWHREYFTEFGQRANAIQQSAHISWFINFVQRNRCSQQSEKKKLINGYITDTEAKLNQPSSKAALPNLLILNFSFKLGTRLRQLCSQWEGISLTAIYKTGF